MRSGAGKEWRESQRGSSGISVEEGSGGSTASPTETGVSGRGEMSSPRMARMRAGSLSSSGGSIPIQPIWLATSTSTSPLPTRHRAGEVAASFDPSTFTMATIRGMDKLEIHFVIAGLKAGLDRAVWEKEGLVEALEESRSVARQLQRVRLFLHMSNEFD